MVKGESLRLDRGGLLAALVLGFTQFCVNFNAVYLAERHITSGVVATVFALLLIPNSLARLGLPRPAAERALRLELAGRGRRDRLAVRPRTARALRRRAGQVVVGIGLTLVGMLGASVANVFQARRESARYPLFGLLAWSMAIGAVIDGALAFAVAGPPVIDPRPGYWVGLLYLALAASVLTFSLYFPVVRKIGPAKAAYSSVLVPIIAMGFSTWLEDYRWTPLAVAGALLALGGMLGALQPAAARL